MKTKKSRKANLENYRTIFLQIGMILTLSAILFAFEWKSAVEIEKLSASSIGWVDITEIPPVTRPKAEIPKKVETPSFVITPDDFEVPVFDPEKFSTEIGVNEPFDMPDFVDIEEVVDEDPIYYNYQEYPKFMGKDDNAFRKYIIENIEFPFDAQENGLVGKVQVQFVVDLDGSLSQIKILRGVHPSIDKEVLRVIQDSPKWEPAIQSGRYVRAMYGIIISFELQ